jgi:hypothetical protein
MDSTKSAAVELVWTKDKPKVAGWYWYKEYKDWPTKVGEVDILNDRLIFDSWDVKYQNGYWAGPIKEPKHD